MSRIACTVSFIFTYKGDEKMNNLLNSANLFLKRNSSTILTWIGAAGVVATAVTAVKATSKAAALLEQAKEEKEDDLTILEKIKVAGPAYIPSALIGASTIACIFGANILNKRQQASVVSAYAIIDNSYKEYKAKLKELYGEDADKEIEGEVAKVQYDRNDIMPIEDGKQLFFDYFSLRYFESTMEEVLRAENAFNKNYSLCGYAALNEFYDTLGIPRVDYGYELGWSKEAADMFYGYDWIDFEHERVDLGDGMDCIIISMSHMPTADYLGF